MTRRRKLIVALAAFALAALLAAYAADAAGPKSKKGSIVTWGWWMDGLTFWAPFTDPANPLTLNKGTGTLTTVGTLATSTVGAYALTWGATWTEGNTRSMRMVCWSTD